MRFVPVGGMALAVVDDDWFEIVAQYDWHLSIDGYAVRTIDTGAGARKSFMHHLIAGRPVGAFVDHENGDRLDNRSANLRIASGSQNQGNRARNSNNRSGYKGVSLHKASGKWRTQLGRTYIGLFDTPIEAAHAYDRAALAAFGPFARTNFPGPQE